MGTGASELQQKGREEPEKVTNVVRNANPSERDTDRFGRRDEIRRRKEQKPQADSKDIANIFNLPPLPATDEGPYPDTEFDPNRRISSDSDDSLIVRVSVSPGELKKRNKDVSLSNLSLDDEPSSKELDSLTSAIDVALEGHDEVMKDIRGVYFIHNVTSRGSADLTSTKSDCNTAVRPKGSTIEPLPGMIPVRVNWSASEKFTEQEKILFQKYESLKAIEESAQQVQEGIRSHETDGRTRDPGNEGKFPLDEEELSEIKPKPIIIRFDYTEEELELMRSIERDYGERYQKMY